MLDADQVHDIVGSLAYTPTGDKIGTVGQVYLDGGGIPAWITVTTDLFASDETFIPADDATFLNGRLELPVTVDQVIQAPKIDLDQTLTPEEEQALRQYYQRAG